MSHKILIVDDEKDLANLVKLNLEVEGFQCSIANSGEEALDKLNSELPDLIILDIRMPGMDGFEVLRKLKSEDKLKNIPVMMFTTCTQEKDKQLAYQIGAAAYLEKPFDPSRMLDRVKNLVEPSKSK